MAQERETQLTEDQRKDIFLALVEEQDKNPGVAQSRKVIAEKFSISENQIKQIERDGLEGQWPPL